MWSVAFFLWRKENATKCRLEFKWELELKCKLTSKIEIVLF
jgi:hypothetical protein